jgi:uncharacterized Zn-binding protein involved in type VI secretion
MTNPDGSPHTGGPVNPPGAPTVKIGGSAAAVIGTICTCAGPPDTITKGSKTVIIGGKGAARMGDSTAHQGSITGGLQTVIIGD